jgi:hypothetical protein
MSCCSERCVCLCLSYTRSRLQCGCGQRAQPHRTGRDRLQGRHHNITSTSYILCTNERAEAFFFFFFYASRLFLTTPIYVDKRRIIKSPFPAGCDWGKAIATLIREALAGRAAQSARLILILYLYYVTVSRLPRGCRQRDQPHRAGRGRLRSRAKA